MEIMTSTLWALYYDGDKEATIQVQIAPSFLEPDTHLGYVPHLRLYAVRLGIG